MTDTSTNSGFLRSLGLVRKTEYDNLLASFKTVKEDVRKELEAEVRKYLEVDCNERIKNVESKLSEKCRKNSRLKCENRIQKRKIDELKRKIDELTKAMEILEEKYHNLLTEKIELHKACKDFIKTKGQ